MEEYPQEMMDSETNLSITAVVLSFSCSQPYSTPVPAGVTLVVTPETEKTD